MRNFLVLAILMVATMFNCSNEHDLNEQNRKAAPEIYKGVFVSTSPAFRGTFEIVKNGGKMKATVIKSSGATRHLASRDGLYFTDGNETSLIMRYANGVAYIKQFTYETFSAQAVMERETANRLVVAQTGTYECNCNLPSNVLNLITVNGNEITGQATYYGAVYPTTGTVDGNGTISGAIDIAGLYDVAYTGQMDGDCVGGTWTFQTIDGTWQNDCE